MNEVPVIPDSAPFTPEQRAYLNGFLAGLFSRSTATAAPSSATPAAKPPTLAPLAILFASQTGNCERLAKRAAKEAGKHGFAPIIHDLAAYSPAQLAEESAALVLASTYGDGEPPDNARTFWDALSAPETPPLNRLRFSLCALGDSSYPQFCGFGKALDARLQKLGAQPAFPRVDCDVEFDQSFLAWLNASVSSLASTNQAEIRQTLPEMPSPKSVPAIAETGGGHPPSTRTAYDKSNPFPARLKTNRRLNGPGSGKDVRHFEIVLEGSGLAYEAGDALGVIPQNDPALVEEIISALNASGDEPVPAKDSQSVPIREALTRMFEITRIPRALLETVAERTRDATLQRVIAPDANGTFSAFVHGREIIDLLLAHRSVSWTPPEFTALLRRLQPRLYSISSSPQAHPGEVHLTVASVRYESLGRQRAGVCSTFLADRVNSTIPVPVFVHGNKAFRPPSGDTPLIMVGPGTGIAPFRAFLEDRRATGATGRNWLFFGDQKSTTDFLYRDEIEGFHKDGHLARLDLAWSRDQADKIYVQDRMIENAPEVWRWLEDGASVYVCGDASRMAKDVDAALHAVIARAAGKSEAEAVDYVKQLKAQKRYQRDVY